MSQSLLKKAVNIYWKTVFYSFVFFPLRNKIIRKVIDIPKGSDPPTFFANIFASLYHYESKWIKKIKKDRHKKITLDINDLTTLNDGGERGFRKSFLQN